MGMETLGTHGNTRHGDTSLTITPPSPKARPVPVQHPTGRGVGTLEAVSRDTETGDFQGSARSGTHEQGARAAMQGA